MNGPIRNLAREEYCVNKIKLSVIIVAYKNKKLLDDCIKSINANNDAIAETEIIVVDNSPNEEVSDLIKNTYPNVVFIKSNNRGFGAGNNEGVRISKGDYLLFLNPDTVLLEPVFKFAINKFEADSRLGIFGVKLLNRNRKNTFSFFLIDRYNFISVLIQRFCNIFGIFIPNIMHIHGADMFIRKKFFVDAGMFDENIFMYEEEADITKRIKAKYPLMKNRFFSEKRIVHLEGSSSIGFEGMKNTIHRLMKTEKYYCEKYNISINKRIRQRLQYFKVKALLYKFINKEKYLREKEYIDIYMSYMK